MKKLIALMSLVGLLAHADTKISDLPLGNASSANASDSWPFVNSTARQTQRLLESDLPNLPSFQSAFLGLIPSQAGNTGKCLHTDGSITSWGVCGTGTVTSVALSDGSGSPIYSISGSPITSSGTLTFTLSTEAANLVFAGPTSGGVTQPTFRSLVGADLPLATGANIGATSATTQTFGGNKTFNGSVFVNAGQVSNIASIDNFSVNLFNGNFLNLWDNTNTHSVGLFAPASVSGSYDLAFPAAQGGVNTILQNDGSGNFSWITNTVGTVTSVAMTVPTFLSIAGSPVTSSGTLAVSLSGTALPILNGGTGQTTASAAFNALSPVTTLGDIIYGTGSNTDGRLAGNITSTKQYLSQTGTGAVSAAPAWSTPACGDLSNAAASCSTDTTNASNISTGTLGVAEGGTGRNSLTNHGVLVGATTSAITQLGAAAAGTLLTGQGASADPSFSATPTLGINGTTTGQLNMATSAGSGQSVTIQNRSTTSAWNFNLPSTAGSSGQALTSQAGGTSDMTWTSVLSNPMTTLGDIIYENVTPVPARLAGNTTSTKNFLTQTGTGSVSAVPAWGTIATGDVPDLGATYLKKANNLSDVAAPSTSFNNISPVTAKGDLVVGNGTNSNTRVGVGSNQYLLTADSSQSTGVKWAAAPASGAKNYLSFYTASTSSSTVNPGNGNFELNATTGWSLAHSSLTSAFPSTVGSANNAFSSAGGAHGGSAANGNLSQAIVSSNQLQGLYSDSYVSSSATTAGDMLISDAFWIDSEDQAKVMTIKFYYQAQANASNGNWSGTSSNSFGVAIYNVTSAAWIMPAGVWCTTQSSGIGYCTGTFQTTSSDTQYQLAIFNANATAGAITMYFDDFFLGPQTAPIGPAMTDWTSFTPTGSWSTNTTYTGWWKREGDKLSMIVKVALAGAPTSASLTVNVPSGLVIDTAKLPASASGFQKVGQLHGQGAAHSFTGDVFYSTTTSVGFSYILDGNTASIMTETPITQAAPYIFANADFIYATISNIPIAGWSSNSTQSSDTDTRVIEFEVYKATNQTGVNPNATDVLINFDTVKTDNTASYDTTNHKWIAPVTGYYVFQGRTVIASTNVLANSYFVSFYKNSSLVSRTGSTVPGAGVGFTISGSSPPIQMNAGDNVQLEFFGSGNNSASTLTMTGGDTISTFSGYRLTGPAVITATETVTARYFASATTISGSLATINWTTKDYDSHNAMSSGTYTIPVSGKYQINTAVATTGTFALNNQVILEIQKNGSVVTRTKEYAGGIVTDLTATVGDIINCNAGDTIRVQVSSGATSPTIVSSNFENFFSIIREGN